MRNILAKVIGWVVALLGGFFAVAGAQLLLLGGSPYYVLTGIAMVVSGALTGRLDRRGPLLFLAVWIATLIWAIWEVGTDWLQLVPRVVAPTVLLVLVGLPFLFGSRRRPAIVRGVAVTAMGIVAVAGAAVVLRPAPSSAQDGAAASTPKSEQAGAGDWQAYGGTLAGDRYSALAQITPANVGRLQLAWTQRTGDVVQHDEAVTHLREYHSEATPIHVGDSLYTCTPHSYVQAIDATTGRTRWTWHTNADVKGNSYLVCRGVSYFAAPAGTPCPRRIFAPTFDAKIYALDADTGRPCAGFGKNGAGYIDLRDQMGASPASFQLSTSPPVVANNRLIIGERIVDNVGVHEPAGVVRAYDPVSGARLGLGHRPRRRRHQAADR